MFKWVAAVIGFYLFRYPGAILGFLVGSFIDSSTKSGSGGGGIGFFGSRSVAERVVFIVVPQELELPWKYLIQS